MDGAFARTDRQKPTKRGGSGVRPAPRFTFGQVKSAKGKDIRSGRQGVKLDSSLKPGSTVVVGRDERTRSAPGEQEQFRVGACQS